MFSRLKNSSLQPTTCTVIQITDVNINTLILTRDCYFNIK